MADGIPGGVSTWDPRQPWKHGEKRGDLNATRVFDYAFGRWQVGLTRQYIGDTYGYPGSDGWRWSFAFVRNPKREFGGLRG